MHISMSDILCLLTAFKQNIIYTKLYSIETEMHLIKTDIIRYYLLPNSTALNL